MKKTYLDEILTYYFNVKDLNEKYWKEDDNGFYTTNKEEINWFKRLNKAYNEIPYHTLITIKFNDYDSIIEYFERGY